MALQAPQYNGPRMGQMPFVPADADAFGAAEARQAGRLARQGLGASLDVLEAAQEQQRRCDNAAVKDATNQMRMEMLGESERILAGDGVNAPEEMSAAFERIKGKYGAVIAGGNIERQEMFDDFSQGIRQSYGLLAAKKQVAGEIRREQDAIDLQNAAVSKEIEVFSRGIDVFFGPGSNDFHVNKDGDVLPPVRFDDLIAMRLNRGRDNIAERGRLAGWPESYIRQSQDEWEAGAHGSIADAMSENNPRKALEWIGQRQVREIMGEKAWKAQRDKIAGFIVKDENLRLANQLSEQHDSEDDLPDVIDEVMPGASAERKESVRKLSAAKIRGKRSAQARDRRALDDTALDVMRQSGWDVDKIDPNWPEDLQDKMRDKAEKELAAGIKKAQKAKGIEHLKLSPDELDKKILDGEWIGMMEDVGGADSPEGKKLITLANKDNPASRSAVGGSGGRTMLEYAASEYERLVGNPRSGKRKGDFAKFIQRVDEERAELAAELGVDPQLIPNSKQKEIIDKWLMNGDWRWFESMPGLLSFNRRRYLVSDEEMSGWKPFETASGAGAAASKEEELPEFARQYFGPRDRARELLPDGSVMIESSNGTVSIIRPDGSMEGEQ